MSPFNYLAKTAATFPDSVAFKVPKPYKHGNSTEWTPITFKQFANDVHDYAKYWSDILQSNDINKRDVVVLWWVSAANNSYHTNSLRAGLKVLHMMRLCTSMLS